MSVRSLTEDENGSHPFPERLCRPPVFFYPRPSRGEGKGESAQWLTGRDAEN
jgi:hypothetical protein